VFLLARMGQAPSALQVFLVISDVQVGH